MQLVGRLAHRLGLEGPTFPRDEQPGFSKRPDPLSLVVVAQPDSDPLRRKLSVDELLRIEDRERRERLTRGILRTLAAFVGLTFALSLLAPTNRISSGLIVFGTLLLVVVSAYGLLRRGHAELAGWVLSGAFALIVFAATWFFGGLGQQSAAAYLIVVMVAAASLGPRAALFFGGFGIAATTFVLVAELRGWLPEPVQPSSILNAWLSVCVSISAASAMIVFIMRSLRSTLRRAVVASEERDAARTRYLQAQKLEPVGRLASAVAHDFNNLLTVISGSSALLRQPDVGEALRTELLDDIDGATARATQMTGQLLAFTRHRQEDPAVFDAGEVARGMAPLLARLLGSDVRLTLELHEEPCPVLADRGQFEQIILNLAVNARDAMPLGGDLSIVVQPVDDDVALVVEDSGVGMSPALLGQVFSPFFTTKTNGTGIGLATVKDITEHFGGSVSVTSEEGVGSRFEVRLPRSEWLTPSVVMRLAPREFRGTGRLLLVEDHDLVRRTTKLALERGGYEVTSVIDGAEALALLGKEHHFDVVVSDAVMPRVGGIELILRLRENGISIPILLVSGNLEALPEDLGRLRSPLHFLRKPFSAEGLLAAVGELLGRARVADER